MEPDFEQIAIKPIEASDFEAIAIKKKKGRPKSTPIAKPPPDSNIYIYKEGKYIDINDSGLIEGIKSIDDIDIKAKLTKQELTFINIYFNSPRVKGKGRVTINNAMIAAGYGNYSERWRGVLARKIIQKYELSAPDGAKVLQALGYGPVKNALDLIDKAENANSEVVSLNAIIHASKINRMVEDHEDRTRGVSITINTGPPAGAAPGAPGQPAGPPTIVIVGEDSAPPPPQQPLRITR
jgi:hypothetical protein